MRDPNDNFSNETVTARLGGGGSRIRNITMRGHGGGLAAPAGPARRRRLPEPPCAGAETWAGWPEPRGQAAGDRHRRVAHSGCPALPTADCCLAWCPPAVTGPQSAPVCLRTPLIHRLAGEALRTTKQVTNKQHFVAGPYCPLPDGCLTPVRHLLASLMITVRLRSGRAVKAAHGGYAYGAV